MKKVKDTILFIVITTFLLTGCKEQPNAVPPTLELQSPADGAVISSDKPISYKAQIDDDARLLNYVVIIQTKHAYEAGKSNFVIDPYAYSRTFAIDGTSLLAEQAIPVELDIRRDMYVLETYATDYWGNISEREKSVFELLNVNDTVRPVLDITSLQAGNPSYFPAGSSFQLEGTAEDNLELGLLDIRFTKIGAEEEFSSAQIDLENNIAVLNETVDVPEEQGNYLMELILRDNVNNTSSKEYTIIAN